VANYILDKLHSLNLPDSQRRTSLHQIDPSLEDRAYAGPEIDLLEVESIEALT
jgi:hypothetical protein